MAATVTIVGEGGAVIEMDLPLPEPIAARLAAGQLRRLDPAPGTGHADGPPARSAPKADWVAHAVRTGRMPREDAEAMTKTDLIDTLGGE